MDKNSHPWPEYISLFDPQNMFTLFSSSSSVGGSESVSHSDSLTGVGRRTGRGPLRRTGDLLIQIILVTQSEYLKDLTIDIAAVSRRNKRYGRLKQRAECDPVDLVEEGVQIVIRQNAR